MQGSVKGAEGDHMQITSTQTGAATNDYFHYRLKGLALALGSNVLVLITILLVTCEQ